MGQSHGVSNTEKDDLLESQVNRDGEKLFFEHAGLRDWGCVDRKKKMECEAVGWRL